MILLLIPASVFFFILIVLLKLICVYISGDKKKRAGANTGNNQAVLNDGGTGSRHYGEFEDEDDEDPAVTEAVVGVYFKIMDKVVYETYEVAPSAVKVDENGQIVEEPAPVDPRNKPYMLQQKQCRMCLKFF